MRTLKHFCATAFAFGFFACGLNFSLAGENSEGVDISKFEMTFSEEFDNLDVSAWGPATKWIAHTPWMGDFGAAAFSNPGTEFPFTVRDGILRIEARKGTNGRWRSGLLASVDKQGRGFSQQDGYFEMRAKFPRGPAVWPGFWLVGIDRSQHTAEVDIVEHYGSRSDGYTSTVHTWFRNGKHHVDWKRISVSESLSVDFHNYSALLERDWITIYFDGREVMRSSRPKEHHQPMMILLNLALTDKNVEAMPEGSVYMYVDYVRAYRRKAH